MEATNLIAKARAIRPGQLVRVTFNQDSEGITALRRLRKSYCRADGLWIAPADQSTVEAVLTSDDWEHGDRTVGFFNFHTLLDGVLNGFAKDIERVAIA